MWSTIGICCAALVGWMILGLAIMLIVALVALFIVSVRGENIEASEAFETIWNLVKAAFIWPFLVKELYDYIIDECTTTEEEKEV